MKTSNIITLAPGHASPQMVPTAVLGPDGISGMTGLFLRRGEEHAVVPDDSPEPGISETLALSLVERGLCIYVGVPEGDEEEEGEGAAEAAPAPVAASVKETKKAMPALPPSPPSPAPEAKPESGTSDASDADRGTGSAQNQSA